MKYLLNYLEGIPDAPSIVDPDFQQLLANVQAGKSQTKTNDAFYESLEQIANELKKNPDAAAFVKPVSKRDAPDYYEVIKKPMDLTTVLRNIKGHKYQNKAQFAADLDLIWDNCLRYNQLESHPLRACARRMKQIADHHLEFLEDRQNRGSAAIAHLLPTSSLGAGAGSPAGSHRAAAAGSAGTRAQSTLRGSSVLPADQEDAAGESDDAQGEADLTEPLRTDGPSQAALKPGESRIRRGTSVATATGDGSGGSRTAQTAFRATPAFRPKLQMSLESAPALTRTPHAMGGFQRISLATAGPSFSDKGKAKELFNGVTAPAWHPSAWTDTVPAATAVEDDAYAQLEASWWGALGKDDFFGSGVPAVPAMLSPDGLELQARQRGRKRRRDALEPSRRLVHGDRRGDSAAMDIDDGDGVVTNSAERSADREGTPPLVKSRPLKLENVVLRSVDHLSEARRYIHHVQEFQRAELEGAALPPLVLSEPSRAARQEEKAARKRRERFEREEARERAEMGGEVGQAEAALSLKRSSAALLAHAGFEGANEGALDLFTRMAVNHIQSVGRTFRLLLDGFSHKMTNEEIVLHALYENGQMRPQDVETHIRDEIEREAGKIAEVTKKVKQTYKSTVNPVIEDDMLLADDAEMLIDGNFADELGEDFLGLREMGIAQEYGMSSLSVPSAVFHGRRKKQAEQAANGIRVVAPDYPPPPPFVPLNPTTYTTHVPALLHAFFAHRIAEANAHAAVNPSSSISAGLSGGPPGTTAPGSVSAAAAIHRGLLDDDGYDPAQSQIGPLGHVITKETHGPPAKKKKVDDGSGGGGSTSGGKAVSGGGAGGSKAAGAGAAGTNGDAKAPEKPKKEKKKNPNSGIGKGNWTRPSKEEKARILAAKQAALAGGGGGPNGTASSPPGSEDAAGEDEDADGEAE